MKSLKKWLVSLLIVMMALVYVHPTAAADRPVYANESSFELGMTYNYFDYKEDINPPGKSNENGWLPGIYFDYAFRKKSIIYTKVHFNYSAADVTYDGSTRGGTPITYSDQAAKLFRFEWDIGYPIPIGNDFTLIPYTGYGYRYWSRSQARATSTYISYKEVYNWHYIPVGIKADYKINDRWNIGGSVAANFMFGGKMTAYLSESIGGLNDVDFTLGNKVGFYTELPVTFRFTKNWALVLTPWYEYSAIGKSDNAAVTFGSTVLGYAYEPDSNTHQYGINLGVNLSF